MPIYVFFLVGITWLFCQGIYLLVRMHTLYREYKSSTCKSFLDYFEGKYLESKGETWRRRYNFFYNSRLYRGMNYTLGVCSLVLAVLLLILFIYLWTQGYADLLKESI